MIATSTLSFGNLMRRIVSYLAFAALAVSSLAFSLLFYGGLTTQGISRIAFVVAAGGLEFAKLASVVAPASIGMRARLVRGCLTLVLVIGSVIATVVSVHQGIQPIVVGIEQHVRTDTVRERLIEGYTTDIATVQETLAQLPAEWRITRAETLEHLRSLRAELDRLLLLAEESPSTLLRDRSTGTPELVLTVAQVVGIETPRVVLFLALWIAVLGEIALLWVGRLVSGSNHASQPVSFRDRRSTAVRHYVAMAFPESPGEPVRGIRATAEALGISLRQARSIHAELKRRGFIETAGRFSRASIPRDDALERMRAS